MKNYTLQKENKDYFDLHHPSEGSFKVAKKDLDPATLKKIRSLPLGFADGTPGGVPAPVDETAPASMPVDLNQAPLPSASAPIS